MSEAEFVEHTKNDGNWQSFKNLKVMFADGKASEIDRLFVNPVTNQAICVECKTGPTAKYTPAQRDHVQDLAKGNYMINSRQDIPGYRPGYFLNENYTVRHFIYGVDTVRINRSPVTAAYKREGAKVVYRSSAVRAGTIIAP